MPLTDTSDPPPDGGEPQGSKDPGRPAMLGRRFGLVEAIGMSVGLALALILHTIFIHGTNGWSWLLAVIGGIAVGGACTLFLYGTATDRSDAGGDQPHGRADVGQRGEWRRTLDRRRRRSGSESRPR
jgi:hypothetical protein